MNEERLRRFLTLSLALFMGASLFYVCFRYVLPWCLPFLLALLVAALLEPVVLYLRRKFHFQRGFSALILTLTLLFLLGGLLSLLWSTLLSQTNALLAAARFVAGADRLLERLRVEEGPWCTLKFGRIEAGTVRNAIAAHGRIEGSLRVFSESAFEKMWSWLHELAAGISADLGVGIAITRSEGYPPVINDEALFADAQARLPELATLEKPLLIAEDFAFYQKALPGLFMLLGTGTGIPLHSDRFDFDESVLERGVEIYERFLPLKD